MGGPAQLVPAVFLARGQKCRCSRDAPGFWSARTPTTLRIGGLAPYRHGAWWPRQDLGSAHTDHATHWPSCAVQALGVVSDIARAKMAPRAAFVRQRSRRRAKREGRPSDWIPKPGHSQVVRECERRAPEK